MSTWGVRKVTIAGMAVALVGQVLFSLAPAVLYLHIGRVLVGVGVAASFLGFVTVTKNWFRPEEAATMMGLSIAVGVLGATLGQVSEKPRRTPSQSRQDGEWLTVAVWRVVPCASSEPAVCHC